MLIIFWSLSIWPWHFLLTVLISPGPSALFIYSINIYYLSVFHVPSMQLDTGYTEGNEIGQVPTLTDHSRKTGI